MKKLLLGVATLLAMAASATAADLPIYTKAPPAPTYSWTGFYVGGALGAKWGHTTWTTTSLIEPGFALIGDASSPRDFDPTSFRAGGYLGYNWQFAPQWVAGIEFDSGTSNRTTTSAGIPGCSINCNSGAPGTGVETSSVKLGWDASARARLGYLVSPNLLAYGTGGLAWQNFQSSATCQHSNPDPICITLPGTPFATDTRSVTRTGWTLGGGLESRIYDNWLLRGEYRFSYFGTWSDQLNLGLPGGVPTTVVYQLKASTQILTVGLAYKFGGPIITTH